MMGVERPSLAKPSEYPKVDDVERKHHLLHCEDPPFLSYFRSYLNEAASKEGRVQRAFRGLSHLRLTTNGSARTIRLRNFFRAELEALDFRPPPIRHPPPPYNPATRDKPSPPGTVVAPTPAASDGPREDWEAETDSWDHASEVLNCAKLDFRREKYWPYDCTRQELPLGGGAFIPTSVQAAPLTRYSPLLRVAKSRGFSLTGWGLISTGFSPKSKRKGGETCITSLKGMIFRPLAFPLADLSHSYELPGRLSVDGSMLNSWPHLWRIPLIPGKSWSQMTPG